MQRPVRARTTTLDHHLHTLLVTAGGAMLLGWLATGTAHAATSAQQKCINDQNKRVASLVKAQGKANEACVKDANNGNTGNLGGAGQEQTAAACLTNDVKGKVDKAAQKLLDQHAAQCVAEPPTFGFVDTTTSITAGTTQTTGLVDDLMGPNLDAATLDYVAPDGDASKCQSEALKRSNGVVNTLWKLARKAKKGALKGKSAPPVDSSLELELAVIGYLDADANNKRQKAIDKLTDKVTDTCADTSAAMGVLFRGRCSDSETPADLAACATAVAQCRFCRTLQLADGFATDCDAFDDGDDTNDSCGAFAAAREITDSGDLITGPLAHGQLGDYLLENDVARFIIQDVGQRDMYSVGCFGGNIIDAELRDSPGLDNFLEIQPAVNLETVINATSITIVNDGSDGTAAIVRTCGPDDILDFVNASTVVQEAGFPFPASADDMDEDVTGCTEYILEPDATYLKMVSTIVNNTAIDLPLFVGDYLNAAGEVELWGSTAAGGIGEQLTHTGDLGVLSYIGFGDATGVDYSHVTVPEPNVQGYGSSMFAVSGVAYILHGHRVLNALLGVPPTFTTPGNGENSFVRYFGVGDGSGSNAIDLENLVKSVASGTVQGCVTVDGVPAPGARVTAGPDNGSGITAVSSNWTTDATGCYSGSLPEGDYSIAAWREGTLFEGGGASPMLHPITVAAGAPVTQDMDLPATGHVSVTITDENSAAVPGRVTVVGFDPSPEFVFTGIATTGLFQDQNDIVPFGLVAHRYADATGAASFDLEPGSYQLYVSRGPEYSLYSTPLTVVGGATNNVAAQIGQVIDTTGFVSSDFHVHGLNSADSRVTHIDRVFQYAGEGIDNIVMTDHHAHTDLTPTISALGFSSFVTSTIGEEITSWDAGHYNAYPMTIDPSVPSGGSTDWGVLAPAGLDFPSHGHYVMDPVDLYTLATTGATSTVDTVVQINHIDSHFVPLQIDTSVIPPTSFIDAAGKLSFRMDPTSGNLFHAFDALEVWNSDSRGGQSSFLDERMGIWMNLLNQGIITTAIADTDTHRFTNLASAGATTWTASSTDAPASISSAEVAQSVDAGRAVGGQGVYVQARLVANENPLLIADLTLAGSTLVSITDAVQGVDLEIDVQAPIWAPFDQIEIYANASTIASPTQPTVAELFSATPTSVLTAGIDFTVTQTVVHGAVAGADRLETSVSVPFTNLTEDTWFVVVAKGTDGVSEPMFPVFPKSISTVSNTDLADLIDGNLGESGTLGLGFTNALYVDHDNTGTFEAPLP